MGYKEDFIEFMVRSQVLTFGEFILKSGRKSPYFINAGLYRTGAQIAKLGEYYAACFMAQVEGGADALYGPAYKGIPLVVATAAMLYQQHKVDIPYCFNRKEAKDHGEGGQIIGYKPTDGDRIVMIDDVTTAGTALRENLPIIQSAAKARVIALIISVDRMEKGTGELSAVQQIKNDFGIEVYPIVTVRDILDYLYGREIDGKIIIDGTIKENMERYFEEYGSLEAW
jgi:orotate phosphoribosyltransferase